MRGKRAIIILIFITFGVTGAEGGDMIANPNVINIAAKEYRGGNKNWDIAQDSSGIVYIANNDGLLEYDGTRWTMHRQAACGLIRSVAVDDGNRVFTGGFEEFGCWERDDRGILRYRLLSDGLPEGVFVNEDIWKINVTDEGVWFQSFARIYFYDGEHISVIDPGGFILFMQRVAGRLLMHSRDRILELKGGKLSPVASTAWRGTQLNTIRVILPTGEPDELLLGTATQGLYRLKDGELSLWDTEIGRVIRGYDLNCALRLDSGDYLFGTILNGMYRTDSGGRIINHFNTDGWLQDNTVLSLFGDSGGNVWAGLDKGLARLDYSTDFNFFIDHSGKIGSIYAAAIHGGMLYLGSNRGLFCVPWDEFTAYAPLTKARMIEGTQGQVWALKEFDGELLCGHNNGVMAVKGDRARFIYLGNGVFDMTALAGNGRKRVLASSYSQPMMFEKGGADGYEYATRLDGFSAPGQFIRVDHMENIWIAHMTRNVYRLRADENMSRIISVAEYGRERPGLTGTVKMGRLGGRIVFVADDRFFLYNDIDDSIIPYRQLDALDVKTREINRLVELDRNYHWLIGKNSATLLRYLAPDAEIVKQYDLSNFNVSTVDGFENISPLNDTLSLVCLDNGFLLHNILDMRRSEKLSRAPILKSVHTYDGHGRTDTLKIVPSSVRRIPYKSNNLDFRFAYPDPGGRDVTLRYRLDDISNGWAGVEGSSDIRLERLPRGTYGLRVKAVDVFGEESPEHVYAFKVLAPWYSSRMAVALYVLAGVGIFLVLWVNERIRLRKRHIRRLQMMEKQYLMRQNEQLTGRVKELIDKEIKSDSEWKSFAMHFEQNYKGFFGNVKERFPGLTSGDLKLCACLRMNLSTKDIASLLRISVRGVEIGRYRLRKKMGIDSTVNLNDFFIENF